MNTEIIPQYLQIFHNSSFYKVDIENQCQQRFKMSWNEVRNVVYEKVSKGYDLLPGVNIHPEFLARGIAPYGGNWMVNRFLCVIYLSYTPSRASVECAMKYLQNWNPSEDERVSLRQGVIIDSTWPILTAAHECCPEIVKQVLNSHNLETKKGYRMQGIEIVLEGESISTRKVEIA